MNPKNSRKLFRIALGVGVAFLVLIAGTLPAYAIGNPDSIVINEVYVFRHLLETNDQLYYCRYDVNYSTTPDEDAEDTYLMQLYDTDGTTLLYDRPLNYYQHNIISIYLTAAQALTWEQAYVIKISGNPAVFGALVEGTNVRSRTLAGGDYREVADFGDLMLNEAEILEDDWVITLLESGVLNVTGATYFSLAIPNLSTMAPQIFLATVSSITVMDTNYTGAYAESLHAHQGTKLQNAIQQLAGTFGFSEDWMAIWFVAIAAMVGSGVVYSFTRDPGFSMLAGIPVVAGAAWLGVGLSMFTIVATIMIVCAVLFGVHFILQRFA